jgi:Tfp pilus assembly protein PilF
MPRRIAQRFEHRWQKAIALKPDYAEAFNNRGNALMELKRLDEAVASYDDATTLKPDQLEALNNHGIALMHARLGSEKGGPPFDVKSAEQDCFLCLPRTLIRS